MDFVSIHSESNAQISCCCGAPKQLDFPGLDFEIDPFPPLNNYFYYTAFTTFGPWNVTQGTIDHGGAEYCGGLGLGNPNGQSHFIDLFGSPPTGSIAGTIEYPLYGLTPGFQYTIKFWYATFTSNGSFSANLKIANGSWLNVTWTANNPGAAVWLENIYICCTSDNCDSFLYRYRFEFSHLSNWNAAGRYYNFRMPYRS